MPVIQLDEKTHRYSLKGGTVGVHVPGVTNVLRSSGVINLAWLTEEGRARGSAVHVACHYDDEGDLNEASVHPDVMPYLNAWRNVKKENSFKILEVERKVYHRIYGYAGTIDRLVLYKKRRCIWDIKTGAREPWHELQLAAYKLALESERKANYALHTIYLRPNGRYTIDPHDKPDCETFLAFLRSHNYLLAQGLIDA